ncbi:NAD(P)/FAD-dependent oxidoreductase [Streptomyces sp. MS2A]|nr:NAD(P)/FAD-dependent oxidoreductase [Streptomyces sp. MS2A]
MTHDVIVVGAGPVGLLLARLLARDGADVLVCERRRGPDARSRAIGIHPPGLAALDAAGCGDAVRAEALALDRGEVHSRGRVLAAVSFGGHRSVLTLAQERTDALLRDGLASSGVGLREGCEVTAVADTGADVRVQLTDAAGEREESAAFLVAADGVRSAIRDAMGTRWRPRRGRAWYAMVDVADPAPDRVARLHCEPGGLVESFPLPGDRRRWVLRSRGDRPELTAASFRDEIARRLGAAPAIPEDARPAVFLAAQHRADPLWSGRIVLLGDAAHETSPIGGQGMNLGWADARALAPVLLAARRRGTGDARPAEGLREYARARQRSAVRAQRRAAFYMAMGRPVSGIAVPARETLLRVLGSPPLRERTADLVTMRGA